MSPKKSRCLTKKRTAATPYLLPSSAMASFSESFFVGGLSRITSIGVAQEAMTVLVTDPSSSFLSPVSPWEPITMRSAASAATMAASSLATVPTTYLALAFSVSPLEGRQSGLERPIRLGVVIGIHHLLAQGAGGS